MIEIRNAPKPIIVTPEFELSTPWVINCGGLDAPLLSKGLKNAPNAYFAKGHYYSYSARSLSQGSFTRSRKREGWVST